MTAPEPRTWTLEMPAGMKLLTLNDRPHWTARYAITKELRQAAGWLAKAKHIPHLERARITVEYQPPRLTRSRDGGNWSISGKAAIDGLRDAGVLSDDDSEHLIEEAYRIGEPFPRGRLVLHIAEVTGGQ